MGMFIKEIVYNQAFIDQTSRRKGDERNREFWQKMGNLHSSYPDCDILIEAYAKEHFSTGIAEDLKITCSSSDVQDLANRIYNTDYYVVPLKLSELGCAEKDEVIAHILQNG